MLDRLRFYFNRLQERLWVRPLLFCILSVAAAFLARATDNWGIAHLVPDLSSESVTTLLRVMSSSMLVIATFAVGFSLFAVESVRHIQVVVVGQRRRRDCRQWDAFICRAKQHIGV